MGFELTAEFFVYLAGILLSLGFSYIPKLESWFDGQESKTKALIMLGSLFVVSIGIVGLSCSNLYVLIECTQAGVTAVVETFIGAAIANQTTYAFTKNIPLWKKDQEYDIELVDGVQGLPK